MSFLVLMFIVIVVAFAVGVNTLTLSGDSGSVLVAGLGALLGGSLVVASAISFLVYILLSFDYVASEHKAKILNEEYGTSYTQQEVFFASSVIDTVRELDRKRIEVNGDLMKQD